jgi:hypothetical protein
MHDNHNGGGSGTTSRRHSVSVVQPRRGIVGFNAPGASTDDEPTRTPYPVLWSVVLWPWWADAQ